VRCACRARDRASPDMRRALRGARRPLAGRMRRAVRHCRRHGEELPVPVRAAMAAMASELVPRAFPDDRCGAAS
jgi:hypothetical protein